MCKNFHISLDRFLTVFIILCFGLLIGCLDFGGKNVRSVWLPGSNETPERGSGGEEGENQEGSNQAPETDSGGEEGENQEGSNQAPETDSGGEEEESQEGSNLQDSTPTYTYALDYQQASSYLSESQCPDTITLEVTDEEVEVSVAGGELFEANDFDMADFAGLDMRTFTATRDSLNGDLEFLKPNTTERATNGLFTTGYIYPLLDESEDERNIYKGVLVALKQIEPETLESEICTGLSRFATLLFQMNTDTFSPPRVEINGQNITTTNLVFNVLAICQNFINRSRPYDNPKPLCTMTVGGLE